MADLRTPIAKARDAYIEANPAATRADTLGQHSPDYFLRNRIEAAFVAGWNAALESKEPTNG